MKYLFAAVLFLIWQYALGGEVAASLEEEHISEEPSSLQSVAREKRQFQHGYGYGIPYTNGYMGHYENGMMNPIISPQQMYPNQAGVGRGLSTFMNPLNTLSNMMGIGRAAHPAYGHQKHLSSPMDNDDHHQQLLWPYYQPSPDIMKYEPSAYMDFNHLTGRYAAEPVANYILSAPRRLNGYFYE